MRILLFFTVFAFLSHSADAQLSRRAAASSFDNLIRWNPVFSEGHTGFSICDLETGDQLYGYNAERYFVPASNVKLLTLYVAQRMLGGRVPGMYYREHGDTTEVWGTGYPLLLHPNFAEVDELSPILRNLQGTLRLNFPAGETPARYGSGWSWDDYNYGYVYERSSLPVYGNRLYLDYYPPESAAPVGLYGAPPGVVSTLVQDANQRRTIDRSEGSNQFTVNGTFQDPRNFPLERPLTITPEVTVGHLAAAFPQLSVTAGNQPRPTAGELKTAYVNLPDTVYRKVLQESDNYLAEQLILLAAAKRYGWSDEETFFDYAIDTLFREIQLGDFRFVDGSGLSRYNLVKPRQFTQLLTVMTKQIGRDRLISLLPAGGESGTLERRFDNRFDTYIWAKTGTLSGVACVSGLIRCQSGRWLAFSFMHNNIMGRTSDYYREMEDALGWAYDNL